MQQSLLTPIQVERLAAHAHGHSDAVMFLAYSGLRNSEWFRLKVKLVSIKYGTVKTAPVLDAARSKFEGRTC
ncbi:hypothetical protein SAMN04489860_1045 [Paraoerskovia marina]|uniref:Phage integrase family protein n=1 Tax=Paraoerskovia marina TaxID=545619 RepID=A0A1H1QC14_9CELL|nr:hypothetical protein [Paraoerskovia marina]SDS21081.1 hypothetical protein SAMN04489860_1045 [Paraoerskovia marina]